MKRNEEQIYGIRSVIEAVQANQTINSIYIKEGYQGELMGEMLRLLKEKSIPFQFIPREKLVSLGAKNHQGVVAKVAPVDYFTLNDLLANVLAEKEAPVLLMLDRITDVRNFGAIARSAECAGADALIIPIRNAAKITPDAVKTSAGALYTLPVCRELNLKKVVKSLRKEGFQIIAATEKAESKYTDIDYKKPTVIVMGSEDTGIDEEILKFSDEQVTIPQKGKIASLNVSAAATVLLYEIVRQRQVD